MEFLQSPFVQTIAALILYFLIKGFYLKYWETKGSNQATKEDIGEITKIAENIKSELSLLNQHKFSYKTAEREALFDYNKKYYAWFYYMVRFSFSSYSEENYFELDKINEELTKRQFECDIAEGHATLFCHDGEFNRIKKEISVAIINFENVFSQSKLKIRYQYRIFSIKKEHRESYNIIDEHNKMAEEVKAIMKEYREGYLPYFKQFVNSNREMIAYINKKIKSAE